jgi:negative regulator of replication initiation
LLFEYEGGKRMSYYQPEEYELLRLARISGGVSKVKGLLQAMKDNNISTDTLMLYLKTIEYKIPSPIERRIEELEKRLAALDGKAPKVQPHLEEEKPPSKRSTYIKKGYTGKMINAFVFNGKRYTVKSWKQLLLTVCNTIANLHKDFDKVLSLKGKKRPYFTKNANELRAPKKISGTDIFVETNLPANHIVSLSEIVLSLFRYNEHLIIEIKPESAVNESFP